MSPRCVKRSQAQTWPKFLFQTDLISPPAGIGGSVAEWIVPNTSAFGLLSYLTQASFEKEPGLH